MKYPSHRVLIRAAAALLTLWPLALAAQEVDPKFWVTDGPIYTLARGGNTLYLGGSFSTVGPNTGGGATLDASSGAVLPPYAAMLGTIYACAADGEGGWYIGGQFSSVGGLPRSNLAHLMADGTVSAWAPEPNNRVLSLAVTETLVYVGGRFTNIGGQTRTRIAAVRRDTGAVTSWNPNANGDVNALVSQGGTIYAGGLFTNIGGFLRQRLAAVSAATAVPTAWIADANGGVQTIVVTGTTVYAGGSFTSVSGTTRNRLAALDITTGAVLAWNPNAGNDVLSMVLQGATMYIGGAFSTIGGQSRNRLAAVDAVTGVATAWQPAVGNTVYAVVTDGTTVYVGGDFTTAGGQTRRYAASFGAVTGALTGWNPNPSGRVNCLSMAGGLVYAGGLFSIIGGLERHHLAAIDLTTGIATSWNPDADASVNALVVADTTVFAGGTFTTIGGPDGGLERLSLAEISKATGVPTSWNPGTDGFVDALELDSSTLYVGGNFYLIGGEARPRIGAIDVASGVPTSWNPEASSAVYDIALAGETLYAAGEFNWIGGQFRNGLAELDVTSGLATSWDPGANSESSRLAVGASAVYVTGFFTSIGGAARNYLAALDRATGAATSWNPAPNSSTTDIALSTDGSRVYVGGGFTSIGGASRNRLAELHAQTGAATAWDPDADDAVFELLVDGSTVYAGGRFIAMGGVVRRRFAVLGGGAQHAISGTVYQSETMSSAPCTPSGAGLAGRLVLATPIGAGEESIASTRADGSYYLPLAYGDYTISLLPRDNWVQTCPAGISSPNYTLRVDGDVTGLNFAATGGNDLSIRVEASARPRPGFGLQYRVACANDGVTAATADLFLDLPPQAGYVGSSDGGVYNGSRVDWSLPLTGGETRFLVVDMTLAGHVPLGDTLVAHAHVNPVVGEVPLLNNDDDVFSRVVGSLDPNDKQVTPEGAIVADQRLTYLVRFQNVGTAEAVNVVVRDTLDAYLDLSTIALTNASHAHELEVQGNEIVWRFPNIMLPDSTSDEPGSHGFVEFEISPEAGLPLTTEITNRAGIYFDFNPVVLTNTVSNAIGGYSSVASLPATGALRIERITPNPTTGRVRIQLDSPEAGIMTAEIFDVQGRRVRQIQRSAVEQGTAAFDWDSASGARKLAPGIYFLRIALEGTGGMHSATRRLVVLE